MNLYNIKVFIFINLMLFMLYAYNVCIIYKYIFEVKN